MRKKEHFLKILRFLFKILYISYQLFFNIESLIIICLMHLYYNIMQFVCDISVIF